MQLLSKEPLTKPVMTETMRHVLELAVGTCICRVGLVDFFENVKHVCKLVVSFVERLNSVAFSFVMQGKFS
ncbi:hypothetical protein EPI10_032487 [Gossypium australe]|uniref:Uncharacterized protein n=1 Tax=Gossypium australe TaxID=47621 RepID=A0A5B6X783_9ROSI|nr:hypothetical protein EPI10_032487 [Gossypium australe]